MQVRILGVTSVTDLRVVPLLLTIVALLLPVVPSPGQTLFDAQRAPQLFEVNTTLSGVRIDADLVNELGTRTDTDSSGVSGLLAAEITPDSPPYSEISIQGMDLTLAEGWSVTFDYTILGNVTVTADPDSLSLEMVTFGPPAAVLGSNFGQLNNELRLTGTVDVLVTGLLANSIPSGPTFIDVTAPFDIYGAIINEPRGLVVQFPLEANGVFQLDTNEVNFTVSGFVFAVKELPSPLERPTLISPEDGAENTPVDLDLVWNSYDGAVSYSLEVSGNALFTEVIRAESGLVDTTFTLTNLDNSTLYYWRVRGEGPSLLSPWSNPNSFRTLPLPPIAPTLLSPVDGEVNVSRSLLLEWAGVQDAESYRLQVSELQDFTATTVDEHSLNAASYDLSGLDPAKTYYWRVKARNFSGESDWSETWSFTTIDLVPERPTLADPTSGNEESLRPALIWLSAERAVSYELQVSPSSAFSPLIVNESGLADTSYASARLQDGRVHFWRVRAVNVAGISPWSDVWFFTARNQPPAFTSEPVVDAQEDTQFGYAVFVSDPDSDAVTITAPVLPDWMEFVDDGGGSGSLTGVPANADVGEHTVELEATDGTLTSTQTFTVTVENVNDRPSFTSEPVTQAVQDEEYLYRLQAQDVDGDTLRFSVATALPSWLSFADSLNGSAFLSGIPRQADLGPPLDVSVLVTDGIDSTSQSFSIIYIDVNDPPSPPLITAPADSATVIVEGEPSDVITVSWTASLDVDGDIVSYQWDLSTKPDLSSIDVFTTNIDSTLIAIPIGELAQILTAQGIGLNESVVLYHRVVASDGEYEVSSDTFLVNVTRGAVTGTEHASLPEEFALSQNYPNPFNPTTTISYALPEPADVTLTMFDLLGRTVKELASGTQPAGRYEVSFDAGGLPSGVYFYRLEASGCVETKRMVVVR